MEDEIILSDTINSVVIETSKVDRMCDCEKACHKVKYDTDISLESSHVINRYGEEESYMSSLIKEYKTKKEAIKGHKKVVKYFTKHGWDYFFEDTKTKLIHYL